MSRQTIFLKTFDRWKKNCIAFGFGGYSSSNLGPEPQCDRDMTDAGMAGSRNSANAAPPPAGNAGEFSRPWGLSNL
jgi:hypothetical protein